MGKHRNKERAKKAKHERTREPIEELAGDREGNRVAVDTELPITPLMEISDAMTSTIIDIEEIEEPSRWQGDDIDTRPYTLNWKIYSGTQLTRTLPPAEIEAYSGVQIFDICDIGNRASVLVKAQIFFSSCDRVAKIRNGGGEQHTDAVMLVG